MDLNFSFRETQRIGKFWIDIDDRTYKKVIFKIYLVYLDFII